MSSLSSRFLTAIFSLGFLFCYVVIFKLNPSYKNKTYLREASALKNTSGVSISTSAFYYSNDFYLGMKQDDFMSFAYAK